MKRFYGVMCYVTFMVTAACYMVVGPDVQAEVHQLNPTDRAFAEQSWTGEEKEGVIRKASSLEVVWMNGCDPCRRIKLVVKDLQEDGYDITLVYRAKDKRGTTRFPSLYYLGRIGGLVKTEVGYQTADHIKQYLGK